VQFTLILAGFLVILVILLFLRNLSATIIPALALPISVIGTFAIMHALGYSLDNLSLLALTLSVGFVVDDAIVMLENIVRHIENGEEPRSGDQGSAGNRLHHHLDDALADRRVHPGAVHERHRRPPAARVRRHHLRRDPGLRLRLADADADAVQPLPEARRAGAARTRLHGLRALLRYACWAPTGTRSPGAWRTRCGSCFPSPYPGLHRTAVFRGAQGLPAQRRHRADHRLHRRAAGHFLSGNDAAATRRG
jgi:hypothetical protein